VQLQVLATQAIFAVEPKVYALTLSFEWSAFLQAEQHIELPGPFPTGGSATSTTTVCALHDLGAGALVDVETEARNEADGALLRQPALYARRRRPPGPPTRLQPLVRDRDEPSAAL
jgi:hypothetical protein